jgi:hypothetical protein
MSSKDKLLVYIKSSLLTIDALKHRHFQMYKKYKKYNLLLKGTVNVLNTLSVTTLAISFVGIPFILISTAVTSTISSLVTAAMTTVDLDQRTNSHHTSYLQLKDLYDSCTTKLMRPDITEEDLFQMAQELNSKTGLILDSSEPVSGQSDSFRKI